MKDKLTGSKIARYLRSKLYGSDLIIKNITSAHECEKDSFTWIKEYDPELVKKINNKKPSLVICDRVSSKYLRVPHIVSINPRLSFIRAVDWLCKNKDKPFMHPTAIVHEKTVIGSNVTIGPYSVIGPDVEIGDDTRIGAGVVIEKSVKIGKRCVIKSNSVISTEGFGFERDKNGTPIHFPHIGGVIIGDDVWIGACVTIERGTLAKTIICSGSKIDDHVQIGHNSIIGKNSLIMANVVICGGVSIEEECWVAPNSVIKQKIRVEKGSLVGLGSVVIKDVKKGSIVAGVPAKPLGEKYYK